MAQRFVIIVAAGIGSRMNNELPKQFIVLNDRPVMMHTIQRFYEADQNTTIILVLGDNMKEYWKDLCIQYGYEIPHHIVQGGKTRFQSVKNALEYLTKTFDIHSESITAVHDAARPLIQAELINSLFHLAVEKKAVIPAVTSSSSIRLGSEIENKSIDRNCVWEIQTPQVFQTKVILEAYNQQETHLFTDDASVVEKSGNNICIYPGDYRNIKITYPEDIAIACIYLNNLT